jgi:transposase
MGKSNLKRVVHSKKKDNLTPEQKELLELRKRNQQLEMENDILKQAALIFGRRDK